MFLIRRDFRRDNPDITDEQIFIQVRARATQNDTVVNIAEARRDYEAYCFSASLPEYLLDLLPAIEGASS